MRERYPQGTCSGLSFPGQEVQAEARSPPPSDAEDVFKGRQSHLPPCTSPYSRSTGEAGR